MGKGIGVADDIDVDFDQDGLIYGVDQMDESMMVEQSDLSNVLSMVQETGSTDMLTPDEMATYSSYLDEHYSRAVNPDDHLANLAEHLDPEQSENILTRLATDIIEWVETDKSSREEWVKKEARGIRLLGVSTKTVGGGTFKGASKVTHPLLIEAITQFQARAIAEMWPSTGPVKTVVMGDVTDERRQQAERVKGFMNYQYMTVMPGAFEEEDKLLFRLPLSGSCFKKSVYNPMIGGLQSSFIEPSALIVPYSATSLETALRFTEKFEETGNDTMKKISAGIYRDVPLFEAYGDPDTTDTSVESEIDNTEGRRYVSYEGDQPYVRYECYCFLDLKGFEDVDENGKITGVALPYCVTVDYDNQKVLSIRRNWKQGDIKKSRRVLYTHYKFLPGLGFYGYGFIHTIGGLGEAATGALRALLDAAGFANMKGGYRSRDAKISGGAESPGMGEWPEVDASPEEMKSAFFPLPYDEPSQTLYHLLGYIDELGRRFANTTEAMVGEANNNGPVGTTLALIEQGSKVSSGIHLRLHQARAKEFKLMSELNAEYLPDEYPYDVPGESRTVKSADFDAKVDVIPASDPNLVSSTQRIAMAQSTYQLAQENPDLYDKRAANKALLEAMRVPNIDELMPSDEDVPPMDPVSEMAAMLNGQPIQAFREQDHEAHIAVHDAIFSTLSKEQQEQLYPIHLAHLAEHKALDIVLAFEELMGFEITPEMMPIVEQQAAQAAQIFVSESGVQSEADAAAAAFEAEEKRKDAAMMADMKRKDLDVAAKIRRDDDLAGASVERDAMKDVTKSLREIENANALGLNKGASE